MEIAQEARTCIGFRDDASPRTNQLPRYLRHYCSNECMRNAKAQGADHND